MDFIRAIALLLVVFAHSTIFTKSPVQPIGMDCGYMGVIIFFVLSGYLITTLLLREEQQTGSISLRLFYIRRALRLIPALWVFVLVVAIIHLCGGLVETSPHTIVACLIYLRNFFGRGHETAHLWTLSIEEQFYLLWPLLLVLLPRRNHSRLVTAAGIAVAVTAWRMIATQKNLANYGALYMRTDFRFDAPLFGCIVALFLNDFPNVFRSTLRSPLASDVIAIVGFVGTGICVYFTTFERAPAGLGDTVAGLLSVVLLFSQIGAPGYVSRCMTIWPIIAIGQISYGIYLWQQLFLAPEVGGFGILRRFPVDLLVPIAIAILSYWLVEKPFLRIKDQRFHHKRVQAT